VRKGKIMSMSAILGNARSESPTVADRFKDVAVLYMASGVGLSSSQNELKLALERKPTDAGGAATPEEISAKNLTLQMQQAKVIAMKEVLSADQRHTAQVVRA
jgi:hypothetical protein